MTGWRKPATGADNAGLPTLGASEPGGWEVEGGNLRGHFAGHFLSAHALGYAGTGNQAFLHRVNYFVDALGECQDALNAQVGQPGTPPIAWTAGSDTNPQLTYFQSYAFYPALGLSGDLARVLTPGATPMEFSTAGNPVRPFYVNDRTAYHVYFHREEPQVVFAGVDSGVPNVARDDGLTFLDVLWSAAPFATQSRFRHAVRDTASAFVAGGLLSSAQGRQVVSVAERVRLGP